MYSWILAFLIFQYIAVIILVDSQIVHILARKNILSSWILSICPQYSLIDIFGLWFDKIFYKIILYTSRPILESSLCPRSISFFSGKWYLEVQTVY